MYQEIPVGNDNLYAVQRTVEGQVSYLAQVSNPALIGKYDLAMARVTCRIFEGRYGNVEGEQQWLPWPTDGLPSKKPSSMFPPARLSPYDQSARA